MEVFGKIMVFALGFSSEIHLELIFVNRVRGDKLQIVSALLVKHGFSHWIVSAEEVCFHPKWEESCEGFEVLPEGN